MSLVYDPRVMTKQGVLSEDRSVVLWRHWLDHVTVTECMHLQLSGCYLAPILSLLSRHVTLDIEQHTMQWRRPRVTGRWMLWLYAVVMTEVRGGDSLLSHDFSGELLVLTSSRKTWSVLRVIAGSSDIENVSAGGISEIPRESPLLWWYNIV